MNAAISPQEFVERWRGTELRERQTYQAHFIDVCRLLAYDTPSGSGTDSQGNEFVFDAGLKKNSGEQGFADVYLQKHFAIEYKGAGRYKDLRAAYDQLLQYREQLQNPPLLVVTDIQNWEIHTNWPNTEKKIYKFSHEEIASRETVRDYLRHLFYDPGKLHPRRNSEQVTKEAAKAFEMIANNMRDWQADPQRIANFLTKLVFCLFAEDVSLLPTGSKDEVGIFAEIIERTRHDSKLFVQYASDLFGAMANGGNVLYKVIPYFNGSLFDDVRVEELAFEALSELEKASRLNWESVEPSIFGTLFERSLDPKKRSYLGAHYTSREDILLIVEPVLMRPLERQWEAIKEKAAPIRVKYDEALATSNRRNQTNFAKELEDLRGEMLKSLREIKVLDPACGSGNFLYVALQRLMDMEKEVLFHSLFEGLTRPFPEVHPSQMYGIEKDAIAHALASIVVWIGYLQWRRTNGYLTHPKEPILQDIHENIQNMDAILAYDEAGNPCEPEWPAVDVIIGNPPFLGGKKLLSELGEQYLENLRKVYEGRLAGFTDLVTYWFERARTELKKGKVKRTGLLATNSLPTGTNLTVLKNIKETGDIFMAWSDREWILDGASVRVSMIGFDNGSESERYLDGLSVGKINADLTYQVDITIAKKLSENAGLSFIGTQKSGTFDISKALGQKMLNQQNSTGVKNQDVIVPWVNGSDIVGNNRSMYIIDFRADMSEEIASQYEAPFEYVQEHIKPQRTAKHFANYPYWLHWNTRPAMRKAIAPLSNRYIATARNAKHRLFVWLPKITNSDSQVVVVARDDDYFFGVLHSSLHEFWSLRMGSWLGVGNDPRYTPTTTFETFPFPFVPGKEDSSNAAYQAIAKAAKELHEEREAWLNPTRIQPPSPNPSAARSDSTPPQSIGEGELKSSGGELKVSSKDLKDRTLTNLYNALNVFRGKEKMKVKEAAGNFAPRLDALHVALDKAVCDAYGWPHDILQDEEAILGRLLALNLERAK